MTKEFYIFFYKTDRNRWWKYLLNKDLNHCGVMETIYIGSKSLSIRFENLYNVIKTKVYIGYLANEFVKEMLKIPFMKCIKIRKKINPNKRFYDFFRFDCVSFVKKILNINKIWIITPRQLFDYILKYERKNILWAQV